MRTLLTTLCALTLLLGSVVRANDSGSGSTLTLVVMDPLAGPLACDCVQGYAQRKYEKLGEFLTKKLAKKVNVIWAENLKAGLEESKGAADLIIGKHSVVLADAAANKVAVKPLARLTDQKDSADQTGMFVVRTGDPAKTVADLKGYRILFGPADCDEKSVAMVELLKANSISVPSPMETAPSCSTAAVTLMELPADTKAAAVISSYAAPLLEGCKKVKKGDLRVIGESKPVPFITAFVRKDLPMETVDLIAKALDDVGLDAQLLIDLETASGFEPWKDEASKTDKKVTEIKTSTR